MVNKLYESVDIILAKLALAVRELAEKDIRITELESERIILGTALGWLAEAAEGYIEYKPGVDWDPGENCIDELLDALAHTEAIICDMPTTKTLVDIEKLRNEIRLAAIEECAKYVEMPCGDRIEDLITETLAADLRHMAKITK